jgi:3-phenylpropionate/trans-cinnamate dioxygenase ferredoxin reductase subunit
VSDGPLRRVTVVGASLAGLSAARALRAQGFDGRLVVIGDEQRLPYDRPPLSKEILSGTYSADDINLLDDDEDLDVDWRLGTAAVSLDPATRAVTLADGDVVPGDGVVLATGARARRLPGTDDLAGVHVVRTLDDALALRDAMSRAAHLVLVGAGFIGAEVASSARSLGLEVTVVEAAPTPLAVPLGVEMGTLCARLHTDHGVALRTHVGVAGLEGNGAVEAVVLSDGTRLAADLVVLGIGAQPNVSWLAGSGLEIADGVVTDATCATNIPGIVAVGDCAASYDVHAQEVVRSEHWTRALEQPAAAVATLLNRDGTAQPYTAVPYFWSSQYGRMLQFAGHRRAQDTVRIVHGDVEERSFAAVYERDGRTVAAFAMAAPRPFTRLRKELRVQSAASTGT